MLEVRVSVWAELDDDGKNRLLARPKLKNAADLPEQVAAIIKAVRNTGDKALRFYSQKFDAVDSNDLVLSKALQQQQLAKLTAERKAAIDLAYQNIRTFHSAQLPQDIKLETSPGVLCELKYAAFDSVGLYIPGGSAPLPSTVLMLGVPAQLANCRRVVLVTPPGQPKASDIAPEIIYAAQLCGISEIYTVGGAQAISGFLMGWPSERSTSRTSCTRSFTSGRARSMRSFSLPASLMCLFFWMSSMMRIGSIGGLGRKVMFVTPGAASTFTTP